MPSKKKQSGGKNQLQQKFGSFVSGIKAFLKGSKEVVISTEIIAAGVLLVAVMVVILLGVLGGNRQNVVVDVLDDIAGVQHRHPLTGEVINDPLETDPKVFSVMVENAADAWPLVGLDQAFLVIEAPVEGDIPRFIAFFDAETEVDKIGPVRSARPYYLDWAAEFDALYAHVGGSPEALDLITSSDLRDLNQFFNGDLFYRQNTGGRFAPHNVFTDSELLNLAWEEKAFKDPAYEGWNFETGRSVGNESVSIDWSDGRLYDVDWQYNVDRNQYQRYQSGQPMPIEQDAEVWADNVIVMATDIRVTDNVGRKFLRTIGEGDALLIRNGTREFVEWRKDSPDDRLRFYNADGQEVTMNAGKTWIEVVYELNQAEFYEIE